MISTIFKSGYSIYLVETDAVSSVISELSQMSRKILNWSISIPYTRIKEEQML